MSIFRRQMITDTELKIKGIGSLVRSLGEVDVERLYKTATVTLA